MTTRRVALRLLGGAALVAAGTGTALGQRPGGARQRPQAAPDDNAFEGVPIIDTHAHLVFRRGDGVAVHGAAQAALASMDRLKISRTLLLPPPQPDGFANGYDIDELMPAIRLDPKRFAFLSGGGSLNPLLHRHAAAAEIPATAMRSFESIALKIADSEAAGFGELTVEHLSFEPNHPYVASRPDHPLMLRLAEIAGDRGLPIDLHMEAVPRAMALPPSFAERSSLNPARLQANIERFERLLAHDRRARIVWVHAGWDNTGERTPALMSRLLKDHSNLYMNIKIFGRPADQPNMPLGEGRQIQPAWLAMLRAFPDRFAIGSDSFHAAPQQAGRRPPPNPATRVLVNALPPDLAPRIASGNALKIYRLPAV